MNHTLKKCLICSKELPKNDLVPAWRWDGDKVIEDYLLCVDCFMLDVQKFLKGENIK